MTETPSIHSNDQSNNSAIRLWKKIEEKVGLLFIVVVIVPTLCSIIYLGFWASNVYISDSRYIIRSAQSPLNPSSDYTMQSFLGTPAIMQDSFVVASYITSMDALTSVQKEVDLRAIFTSPSVDIFSRFASFYWNTSQERLLKYFNNRIEVIVDPISFVSTLHVKSYTSDSAQKVNEILLRSSESLINDLNERTRSDIIKFAQKGVNQARTNLENIETELLKYKYKKDKGNAEQFMPQFQVLYIKRDAAERQLAIALEALSQASIEAQRKMIYLERIVEPQKPDYPVEPKRIIGILTTIALSLMIFGILKVVFASVKEHQD
jgi:capsular polysaccharide transport system permease protein